MPLAAAPGQEQREADGERQRAAPGPQAARPDAGEGEERRVEAVEVAQLVGAGAPREPEGAGERRPPSRASGSARRERQPGADGDERGRWRAGRRAAAGSAARSFPSTTRGTCSPTRPRRAWPRSTHALPPEPAGPQRGDRARGGHHLRPRGADEPGRRAAARRRAPGPRPKARAEDGRGRRPATARPAAIPAKAGIASEEFQTARPQTSPRPSEAPAPERRARRAAAPPGRRPAGTPVTRGIRKLGGGPVAVISAM